jgi:uncharacterized protein YcnI
MTAPASRCRQTKEPTMNARTIVCAAATAIAVLAASAAAAQAHVTVQPTEAPAGGFARLDVRVPSEEPTAPTTKVEVQMPPGFADASYEPVPGWRATIATHKLAKPIKASDGDLLTEELSTITFTATGQGLQPGQFQDFGLSLGLPDKPAGTKLTFKALQTYRGGKVVRWIGAPDTEHPAPQVTLVSSDTSGNQAAATPAAATGDTSDDGTDGLTIVALVLGALGLLAGGAALVTARR